MSIQIAIDLYVSFELNVNQTHNVSLKLRFTSETEFGVPPYLCMLYNDSQDMDYSNLCVLKRI
jgi:hypothetical protein